MARGQRIGYFRVSSVGQNPARQLDGVEVDRMFTERSGLLMCSLGCGRCGRRTCPSPVAVFVICLTRLGVVTGSSTSMSRRGRCQPRQRPGALRCLRQQRGKNREGEIPRTGMP